MRTFKRMNWWLLSVILAGCLYPASTVFAQDNVITVYDTEIGQVNKLVFGNNFLGYDPTTYINVGQRDKESVMNYGSGIWDPEGKTSVQEVIDLAKEAGTSIVRFPGGCGTHLYDWKAAIGPGRTEFQYGIDEFMKTADEIGADVVMTVSYYTGDENDAADLVEYLNSPNDGSNPNGGTDWAAERAQNGHPAPYKVKYFEVGNETWGGHPEKYNINNPTPAAYATRYLKYYDSMKEVDSSVEIGVVLYWGSYWNEGVLPVVEDKVDFGVHHTYPVPMIDPTDLAAMDPKEVFRITLGMPLLRDEAVYPHLLKRLKETSGRDIPLAMTEKNGGFLESPHRHSLGNALLNAELLRIFMKPEHNILMANYWMFSNSHFGMVKAELEGDEQAYIDYPYPEPIDYTKRPNYYSYELYNDHFGEVLIDVQVQSGSYEIEDLSLIEYNAFLEELEGYIEEYIDDTSIPYLSVNASKSLDGSKLYLMVINKNMDDSLTTSIDLTDFVLAEGVVGKAWILNGPSVEATNEDDPYNVKVVYEDFQIAGNLFEFTFEPHSLTAMEIAMDTDSISGAITFSYPGIADGDVEVMFQVREPDTLNVIYSFTETITVAGNSGSYTLSNIDAGTYDVIARHPHHLNAIVEDVIVVEGSDTSSVDMTLKAGDADGDNDVDVYDFYGLYYNYQLSGAPWWTP